MTHQARRSRRPARAIGAATLSMLVTLAAPAAVPAAAAHASAPAAPAATCASTTTGGWRTTPSSSPLMTAGTLRGVNAGRHLCFDRLVVTISGSAARTGFFIGYVDQLTQDGSGTVIPLRGGAKIMVVARARAYDDRGRPTYRPRNPREVVRVTGFRTFRQVAWAGSFEGQTTLGIGVRGTLPYRAFVLKTGTVQRLVVDVSHTP
ncbi:MAG: hypothetical protein IPI32_00900 [Austwickia sp.]|jgi:hypothetical protein|nr:hypothetical protein [Austwickia sp.]MBK8437518.1 hypothetical protein [Austwickia sp.]MBK9102784.1 hypothetical protein [Austwickia sp.]